MSRQREPESSPGRLMMAYELETAAPRGMSDLDDLGGDNDVTANGLTANVTADAGDNCGRSWTIHPTLSTVSGAKTRSVGDALECGGGGDAGVDRQGEKHETVGVALHIDDLADASER